MPPTSWLVPVLVALVAACASPPEPAAPPPQTIAATPAPSPLPDIADAPPEELEAAAVLVRRGDWQKARAEAERTRTALGEGAPLDAILVADVLVGRACVGLKDLSCAAAAYRAVSAAWAAPVAATKRLDDLGRNDADRKRRLGRALTALGEALFFAAEARRREVDKLVAPVFRGAGTRDEVVGFVNTELRDWIIAKRPAIEEAERAYKMVVDIQPATPPRWAIAAAERVGSLWAGFVDDFRRAAPIPKEWQSDKDVRDTYWNALVKASEPQLEPARNAYRMCKDYGAKFGIADERVRACEGWLAAHPAP